MLKFRPMTENEFEILVEKDAMDSYIRDIEVYKERFMKASKGKTPREFAERQFATMLPLKEKSPNNFFWVAISGGSDEYIGYIWYTIRHKKRSALLSYILLKEKFRSQGYGTEMILYMENHLKEEFPDIKKITLQVFHHNPRAKQLYKRLGFKTYFKSFTGWNMIKRLRIKK